jgi:SAM-dependent methyltransferase
MTYSLGVAPYYDLFTAHDAPPDLAAEFAVSLMESGSSVLDIGAGTGTTALALAACKFDVTALEPDPEMYSVMLARLAQHHDLSTRITPIPKAAGHAFHTQFDLCMCTAVLHLVSDEEQTSIVRYAAAQIKRGTSRGKVVLNAPMESAQRSAAPWHCVARRSIGELRIEHHVNRLPLSDMRWLTQWRFTSTLRERIINQVTRDFHWRPLTHKQVERLLGSGGLSILATYSGFDRSSYVRDESAALVVVAELG